MSRREDKSGQAENPSMLLEAGMVSTILAYFVFLSDLVIDAEWKGESKALHTSLSALLY